MFRCLVLLVLIAGLPLWARTKPSPIDPEYLPALTAANNFLHAWQSHDEESGILLLSDRLREHTTAEAVSVFFSIHPQQAYEIARGRKVSAGRYQFPVTLWQTPNSGATPHPKPRAAMLIVTRTPKNDWLVDNLP